MGRVGGRYFLFLGSGVRWWFGGSCREMGLYVSVKAHTGMLASLEQ